MEVVSAGAGDSEAAMDVVVAAAAAATAAARGASGSPATFTKSELARAMQLCEAQAVQFLEDFVSRTSGGEDAEALFVHQARFELGELLFLREQFAGAEPHFRVCLRFLDEWGSAPPHARFDASRRRTDRRTRTTLTRAESRTHTHCPRLC